MTQPERFTNDDQYQVWTPAAMWALAGVVLVGLILSWTGRAAALNVNGDDPIYLTLSHSLAQGHYRDEYLVGTPPHGQYPPGLPLWLMLVRVVAGTSLDAALASNLLLFALTAVLLADAMRRVSTTWLGVTAAAVILVNPAMLGLVGVLDSEPPYLACCAIALWASLVEGERGKQWLPAITIAAAIAAFLTRSAGIALLPAVGWAFLLRRRWKPLLIAGALFGAAVAGWFAYTRWASSRTIGHTYAADLSVAAPDRESIRVVGHTIAIAKVYLARFATNQFSIPDIHNFPLDNGIWALLLLIPATIGAWTIRRRWPALVMFLLTYSAMLLLYSWAVQRLMTALLPWLVAVILLGIRRIAKRPGSRRDEWVAISCGMLLVGVGTAAQAEVSRRETNCRATAPYADPRCYTAQVRSYVAAASFIRDSLPSTAVIAASKPSIIYALTHRATFPLELFDRSRSGLLLAPEGVATVILLSRQFPYEAKELAPRLLQRCTTLMVHAQFAEGTIIIGRRSADSDANACAELQQYVNATPSDFGDDSE